VREVREMELNAEAQRTQRKRREDRRGLFMTRRRKKEWPPMNADK